MIVLTLRTDNPQAEIGLFQDGRELQYVTWQAHRELSRTIHHKIEALLQEQKMQWGDLNGIVVFQGPGSFTGLRIGMSVANALSQSLEIPIVATLGDDWIQKGQERLLAGQQDEIALPFYGRDANITAPRK